MLTMAIDIMISLIIRTFFTLNIFIVVKIAHIKSNGFNGCS
ncbi:hypothetical protein SAMN04487911_12230 [Arenibacter nanhaiticus]|uniref:Uncharacterized protein n=1 Tax=Arenibacter nanhaiticus TaxID=558155 RepID=A0A1M6JJZ7_9FLAO|nr:hypothetical protein SAMN04487911_12230 [Arenibacter nanhaiticus]